MNFCQKTSSNRTTPIMMLATSENKKEKNTRKPKERGKEKEKEKNKKSQAEEKRENFWSMIFWESFNQLYA